MPLRLIAFFNQLVVTNQPNLFQFSNPDFSIDITKLYSQNRFKGTSQDCPYLYVAKREHLCKNVIIRGLKFETFFVRYINQ